MRMILILFITSISISINSQTKNDGISFFAGFGTSESTTISRDYNIALSSFASVGYVLCENLMIRMEYQYIRFVNRSESTVIVEEVGDVGNLSIHAIRPDIMYGSFIKCECVQLYLNAGPGIYFIKKSSKLNNETITNSQVSFGIGGGVGLSIGLIERLRFYTEYQYHQIFNDPDIKNYIPVKLGLNYNLY